MVISESHRLLFVHIPKTAGTSISKTLTPEASLKHPLCLPNTKHETIESFIARHSMAVFKSYYSFAVVRHPLQRFIAHFTYLKSHPDKFPELQGIDNLDSYVDAIKANRQDVIRKKERVMAQGQYIVIDGAIHVNEVIRFEKLDEQFENLCQRVGLQGKNLVHENKSMVAAGSPSATVSRFVDDYYADDFALFEYAKANTG